MLFQGKLSETWTDVTKAAIGEAILAATKMEESQRQPQAFMKTPTVSLKFKMESNFLSVKMKHLRILGS